MKIGDKVRFLSEVGGGIVAGFQGKDIVLVEDEDGFQIPTPINEVVVDTGQDYSTQNLVQQKQKQAQTAHPKGRSVKSLLAEGMDVEDDVEDEPVELKDITYRKKPEERKGGNQLSAYWAFVPVDVKAVTTTDFETYIVNDSNYYLRFTYLVAEGNSWTLKAEGEVEPNTKQYIETFGKEHLNAMEHVAVQLLAYKRDAFFTLKPTIDVQLRIDTVKFYKLHTFKENDFFETPALIYTLVENDKPARPLVVDVQTLKQEMYKKETHADAATTISSQSDGYVRRYDNGKKSGNPFVIKRKGDENVEIIDLHADALLDTTQGMTAADIRNYQMEKFHEALAKYSTNKGQRIIFIHGKGNGVLRQLIIHELKYRYKTYQYQDASFQEYGYGATQITIK